MNQLEKLITEHCNKTGIKKKKIAEDTGVTISRFNHIQANPNTIRPEELQPFASYFEISLEDFIQLIKK